MAQQERPDLPEDDAWWFSVAEAARRLGLSDSKVYELVDTGMLECIELGPESGFRRPQRRIPVSSLRAYVNRGRRLRPIRLSPQR